MIGFADVQRIFVRKQQILATQSHLAAVGRTGNEGFVLWVGRPTGAEFHVTEAVVPRQVGHFVGGGVCVTVDGAELHRINVWLHESNLRLIAQVHSHPTDAYHSDTDDSYPIATTVGCISIVVPDFAVRPFSLQECATYRLSAGGQWTELSVDDSKSLIQIKE